MTHPDHPSSKPLAGRSIIDKATRSEFANAASIDRLTAAVDEQTIQTQLYRQRRSAQLGQIITALLGIRTALAALGIVIGMAGIANVLVAL